MTEVSTSHKSQSSLLQAFRHAFAGLREMFRSERNFRIHLVLGILATGFGLVFRFSSLEWCLIVLAIGLVLATEIINSSIETMLDLVHPEQHPLVGRAKDLAAAAVVVTALAALLVAAVVAIPKLWIMVKS